MTAARHLVDGVGCGPLIGADGAGARAFAHPPCTDMILA
jgi:hypothetical protein